MTPQFSSAECVALVCPGHGPQTPAMFDGLTNTATFRVYAPLVCEIAGEDVFGQLTNDDTSAEFVRRNEIASLLVTLASVVRFSNVRNNQIRFQYTGGYSVGQWTAMYFASMLDAETLFRVIWQRAIVMNHMTESGAMLAIIGLPAEQVEAVCSEVSETGGSLSISNYNCIGQTTVAGTAESLKRAAELLRKRGAYKLIPVNAAGAWHSPLMKAAALPFRLFLDSIEIRAATVPVLDNVTGRFLPEHAVALRDTLASHLYKPVQWHQGVQHLIHHGVNVFLEVGHGDMLTKFGYFIDRRKRHLAMS
jgi:[acyl-carrier-protein] S-malonyltransferase